MALMDFIKKQFIDILQWTESGDGTLAWRFPMQEMEIQNGASLTVRDSQVALFVNEGTVADVFAPGMYKLTTQTLPVLTHCAPRGSARQDSSMSAMRSPAWTAEFGST